MKTSGTSASAGSATDAARRYADESESDENEKRWARRRWDDGSEARLELVRDVIRLKSEDKVVDRVDIFGAQVALPIEAMALILALSCASPKDVGFLHLVSPAWANLLGQAAGDAVWALWYKQHFGGGPFITCNRTAPFSVLARVVSCRVMSRRAAP